MKKTIERNKKIIEETKEWSPELQMRIEQTYVLEVMLVALSLDK